MLAGLPLAPVARRYVIVAVICLLVAASTTPFGGTIALAGWSFMGTLAGIFGLSAWIVARSSSSGAAVAQERAATPRGTVRARWSWPDKEWRAAEQALWWRIEAPYYRWATAVGLVLAPVGGVALGILLGPGWGMLFALICAGIGPVGSRLHRWLVAGDRAPGEAIFTTEGFAFGAAGGPWRDQEGDFNLVAVALLPGEPAIIRLDYVAEDDGLWQPALAHVPVAAGHEAEARTLVEWLEIQLSDDLATTER